MAFGIDVRDMVPAIRVPTMVIHQADNQVRHIENSGLTARHIPARHRWNRPVPIISRVACEGSPTESRWLAGG